MNQNVKFYKRFLIQVIFIFLVFFCVFYQLSTFLKRPMLIGNEGSHISLMYSIVFHNTFEIMIGPEDKSEINGRFYSNKPPGYVLAFVGIYKAYLTLLYQNIPEDPVYHVFAFLRFFSVLMGAVSSVLLLLILKFFKLSDMSCFLGVTTAFLGTIYPAYSICANSIPFSIFLCLLVIYSYLLYEKYKNRILFMLCTSCISYATIVDYSNAFFLLPIVIVLLVHISKDFYLVIFSLPSLVPILILLTYNYHVLGDTLTLSYTNYHPPSYINWTDVSHSMSIYNIPNGIYGLLFSSSRGMFVISPILFLGLVGVFFHTKKFKKEQIFVFISSITGILILSSYSLWHGGHAVGYRHILVSAVILSIFCAFFFEKANFYQRGLFLSLLVVSVFTGIFSFGIQATPELLSLTWLAEPEDIHANFYTVLLRSLIIP